MSAVTTAVTITPYLCYEGRCEEAIEFYKKAADAEVGMLMRFKDAPPDACAGGEGCGGEKQAAPDPQKVMHAELNIGGASIMLSDGQCGGQAGFKGINLAIGTDSEDDAKRYYSGLSQGGQPFMPLTKTFFSPAFGMLTDKFGVTWMVMVNGEKP